jgi:hypothetical protein
MKQSTDARRAMSWFARPTSRMLVLAALFLATAAHGQSTEPPFVGVVPNGAADCPAGSPLITVHMDNEDRNNQNDRSGWIGATTSNEYNTTLRFCRVDGRGFKPLSTTDAVINHYAVLQLSQSCPEGATTFSRVFHNEYVDNANRMESSSGLASDLGPNTNWNRDTTLHFCLFKSGAEAMPAFPELGFAYGVFAAPDFAKAQNAGWAYADDEDFAGFSESKVPHADTGNIIGDAGGKRIITPITDRYGTFFNTRINFARTTGCLHQHEEIVIIQNGVWHSVDLATGRRASMPCVDWSNPEAMASTSGYIFTIKSGEFWKTHAATGATSSLGAGWSGSEAMAAANGVVYTIWGGELWRTDGGNGSTRSLGPGWTGTQILAGGVFASRRHVFGVQGDVLWKADGEAVGRSTSLGSGWAGAEAMTYGDDFLYIVWGDQLWKVNASSGHAEVVESSGWSGTEAMTYRAGFIYAVQGGQLWKTSVNGGSVPLGSGWLGTQVMVAVQ